MVDEVELNRNRNRLRQAVQIIQAYDFSVPLGNFLHKLFRENKNMGSNDRKQLSTIIYQYLRLGNNFPEMEIEKKIGIATFLCNTVSRSFSEFVIKNYTPFSPKKTERHVSLKIQIIREFYPEFTIEKIFPLTRYFSKMVNSDLFILSNLIQPRVWIRVKRGMKEEVIQELIENEFSYYENEFSDLCIYFDSHYPLHILKNHKNGNFEIQDGGSQSTGKYFKPNPNETWWDVCAGSGGKGLMLVDEEPSVSLYATDIRKPILDNLKIRFSKTGFRHFETETIDLSGAFRIAMPYESFDGIILDAPCSGSGTWAAAPENLRTFDYKTIVDYHHTQTQIAQNVLPYLKKGKPLIYITCSVYKQENEDVVKFICDNFNMILDSQQIIEGYRFGASTFFVARLIKQE